MKNAQYIIAMLCTSPSVDDNVQSGIVEKFQQFGDSIVKSWNNTISKIQNKENVNCDDNLISRAKVLAYQVSISNDSILLENNNDSNTEFCRWVNGVANVPDELLHHGIEPIAEYRINITEKILRHINLLIDKNSDNDRPKILLKKMLYICYTIVRDYNDMNKLYKQYIARYENVADRQIDKENMCKKFRDVMFWRDICTLRALVDQKSALDIWKEKVYYTGMSNCISYDCV